MDARREVAQFGIMLALTTFRPGTVNALIHPKDGTTENGTATTCASGVR